MYIQGPMKYRFVLKSPSASSAASVSSPPPPAIQIEPLGDGRYAVTRGAAEPAVYIAQRVARGPTGAATWSILPEGGGAQHLIDVEGERPELRVTVGGVVIPIGVRDELDDAGAQQAAGGGGGPATLRAPMPGKVVKLLCQVGDKVKAGQGLLVIEAMKMENELRAPSDGVVHEVRTREGASVDNTMILVVVR